MRVDPAVVLGAIALAGYLAIGAIVKDVYPFSSFPMYAGRSDSASRVLLRDSRGRLHELSDYDSFVCSTPVVIGSGGCSGSFQTTTYLDEAAQRWIDQHPGRDGAGENVSLVRRIWTFPDPDGAPVATDCVLASCSARLAP